jgi:hypothetical protein
MKSLSLILALFFLINTNAVAAGTETKPASKVTKVKKVSSRMPANTVDIGAVLHNLWEGNVATESDWKDEDRDVENSFIEIIQTDFKKSTIAEDPSDDNIIVDPQGGLREGRNKLDRCSVKVGDEFENREVFQKDFWVVNSSGKGINADESWGASKGFNIRINRKLKKVKFILEGANHVEVFSFNDSMKNLVGAARVKCNSVRCEVISCKID